MESTTANWKTYRNGQFQIKHPPTWFIPINTADVVMMSSSQDILHGLGVPLPNEVWIEIVKASDLSCSQAKLTADFEKFDSGAANGGLLEKTECRSGFVITRGLWGNDPMQ